MPVGGGRYFGHGCDRALTKSTTSLSPSSLPPPSPCRSPRLLLPSSTSTPPPHPHCSCLAAHVSSLPPLPLARSRSPSPSSPSHTLGTETKHGVHPPAPQSTACTCACAVAVPLACPTLSRAPIFPFQFSAPSTRRAAWSTIASVSVLQIRLKPMGQAWSSTWYTLHSLTSLC